MLRQLERQFEAASARYAEDNGIERDADWFILKMQEEIGELTQAWNKRTGRGRRHGKSEDDLQADMADEAADLLGHVLLFAHHHDLDLVAAIKRKWKFQVEL